MIRTRRAAAVAVLLSSALALSGCSLFAGITGGAPVTVTTHTNEAVASGLEQFYKQSVTWKSCGGGLDCTTLKAPVDWDKPDGDQITLAISRHKATGKSLGSLLVNPGGPGGSGYDFVHDSAVGGFGTADMLKNYDFIGFDPRGVGKSTPIVCFTKGSDRDENLYGTYDSPYGSAAWATELAAREKKWVDACKANTGPLLAHIDSVSVAHDMDMIRAVLGDKKLNYLGYSFGTYLGTIYANLFPDKVGKMVLDGAVEPPFGTYDELATQYVGFDSAFKAYMTDCLTSSDCPFTGPINQALTQAHALAVGVDGKNLKGSDGRVLDSATVGTGIAVTLYNKQSWPYLSQAFGDLEKGNADTMFYLADQYNGRNDNGSYADNSIDVYFAVTCAEGTIGTDDVTLDQGLAKMQQEAPVVGDILALDDYTLLETACSQWPYPRPTFPSSFEAKGAPPILVVGTTNDPATPYAQSVALAKMLDSGVLITHKGEGHTVYGNNNKCVDTAVDAYFIKGTVPSSDPNC